MHYIFLAVAIIAEVVGTTALKATNEFTKLWPSIIVAFSYIVSFYFMTLAMKSIPVGITYAIWSGVGIVLIAIFGAILYKEILDTPAVFGMGLIILGVIVINAFSKSLTH
ncbi:MAG: multidrug efflux SMR transporter [Deltaproteobacteria bacterium]|jgi:small multidrug resistance pump|nr:multidrug efflux SMR transporter [Deltaproteobacteria bacterium]MBT4269517.1 multidrug efflux SMR transporter [Deltaproteobacteria bacterium]MBT4642640.1 multidrug efflux SMR transporter [Deltaproteobacteria bacterium]MBT6501303.1 multidrug efflux SMR transporter [Deltaproteobacteria bacterium]MBT7151607.1 multidrug efflux SMR transporter [Deltaproteobacteria bacterium]